MSGPPPWPDYGHYAARGRLTRRSARQVWRFVGRLQRWAAAHPHLRGQVREVAVIEGAPGDSVPGLMGAQQQQQQQQWGPPGGGIAGLCRFKLDRRAVMAAFDRVGGGGGVVT